MITVTNIETNSAAPSSSSGGRPPRAVALSVQPVQAPGRELATQRHALFFRSEAILRQEATAQAPYLAQKIGQLWQPASPAFPKAALDAYQKHSPETPDAEDHQASLLA